MESAALLAIVGAAVSSSALGATITHWFLRRKNSADAANVNVTTALLIEERAVMRYHTANEALDAAQAALDVAREQIKFLEGHVVAMHQLVTDAGLVYELPPGLLELIHD